MMNREDFNFIDNSVRPGDDFFQYATGKFTEKFPQPADHPSWMAFDVLEENVVLEQLKSIVADIKMNPQNDVQKMIRDYIAILESPDRNTQGASAIRPYIEKIHAFDDKRSLTEYAIRTLDFDLPISLSTTPDMKDSTRYEIYLYQNLMLYNKEYYKPGDEVMEKFKETAHKVLRLFGYTDDYAAGLIDTYFGFEEQLILLAYSMEDLDKPEINYFPTTVSELVETTGYDIRFFLDCCDYTETERIIVSQPDFVTKFFKMFKDVSLDDLKKIVEFSLVMSSTEDFTDEISDTAWEFEQFRSGAEEREPKWKRNLYEICFGIFSEEIARIYSERFFGAEAKEKTLEMIGMIMTSFREVIMNQKWMSEETKLAAIDKLSAIGVSKVGYPEKWKNDWEGLVIDSGKSLFENSLSISDFAHHYSLRHYYNKNVEPAEWPMYPHVINACFSQLYPVEICFPAAILQMPFFSAGRSDAENYGSIGVIIGHEMTHGFDRNGRQFDKDGNMLNWWTDSDAEEFDQRMVRPMISHFNTLNVTPFLKCNGELQVSENLADNGGLRIALTALKKVLKEKNVSPEQYKEELRKFFISYATSWACVQTEEIKKNNNMNNVHSAPHLRVNGQVVLFDEWFDAFDVREGDDMWVAPEQRLHVW